MIQAKNTAHLQNFSLGVGIVFLGLSIFGFFQDPKQTLQSYLFSYLFWSDLCVGSIPLLMIYHLTGGSWGVATRTILESLSDTIRIVALLFIPIIMGLNQIYPWADPKLATDPKIQHKLSYLNSTAFSIRAILYFAGWVILNHFLQTVKNDETLRKVSAGGLVFIGFTVSFASIDWQMSVEPNWHSTLYGMLFGIGQCLSSYSFCLLIFGLAVKNKKHPIPKNILRDLGNILLALVMTWAYLSFMQYLIIWSGNLPREVTWFQHRTEGGWQWLALILFIFQFAAPLILLLFRSIKDQSVCLALLGGLIFLVRMIDHYWMLIPGLKPDHFEIAWQVFTTEIGIGGIFLASFFKNFSSRPPLLDQMDGLSVSTSVSTSVSSTVSKSVSNSTSNSTSTSVSSYRMKSHKFDSGGEVPAHES